MGRKGTPMYYDGVYQVEEIMDSRGKIGKKQYLIRWTGFVDESDWTWEPQENLINNYMVDLYEEAELKKKRERKEKNEESKRKNEAIKKEKKENIIIENKRLFKPRRKVSEEINLPFLDKDIKIEVKDENLGKEEFFITEYVDGDFKTEIETPEKNITEPIDENLVKLEVEEKASDENDLSTEIVSSGIKEMVMDVMDVDVSVNSNKGKMDQKINMLNICYNKDDARIFVPNYSFNQGIQKIDNEFYFNILNHSSTLERILGTVVNSKTKKVSYLAVYKDTPFIFEIDSFFFKGSSNEANELALNYYQNIYKEQLPSLPSI